MTSTVLGFRSRGSAVVIALPEQPQVGTIVSLRSRSERALNAGHRRIAVDLRAVEHINIPTLAELCVVLRRLTAHGRKVAIIGPDARVQWVLELCAIDRLEVHSTLKSALYQGPASQRERSRRHLLARARPSFKRSPARP